MRVSAKSICAGFLPAMEKSKIRFPERNMVKEYALCRESSREKGRNARMRECWNAGDEKK